MFNFARKKLTGVHVPHQKQNTENCEAVRMPVPARVYISMQQHMGAPCVPLVKKGDTVQVGQLIGSSDKWMSAPVHSSVSGTVADLTEIININSSRSVCVEIETDGLQTVHESVKPPKIDSRADFIESIKNSGLVGLGGAGFPTFIKLNPKNLDEVDTLIVNAAECEPYITSDYRTMMDNWADIIDGITLLQKYLQLSYVYIGIEKNKPRAIELMREKTKDLQGVTVTELDSLYPKGAEKVIAYETCGRVVQEGKLPNDAGLIVSNVTSVAFISRYIKTGMPLIEKTLTVDGSAIKEPKNVTAVIGATYADLIDFCGGSQEPPRILLMGGPMMGTAVLNDAYPVIKNNNALLAFSSVDERPFKETACIRCGKCIRTCPIHLMPANLEAAFQAHDLDMLRKLKLPLCMECGCCAFICPARRPLVQSHRLAKKLLLTAKKEGK